MLKDILRSKGATFKASDDIPLNPNPKVTFDKVTESRYEQRAMPKEAISARAAADRRYLWEEVSHGVDETHHVAPGYSAEILIRWGDPVFADSPPFDPMNQSAAAQRKQFGYNNDYLGYIGLPLGSDNPDHGLLCVNHEYTNEEMMFPGIGRQDNKGFADMTEELVDIELAAHGGTVIELKREGGRWRVVTDGQYNRRITGGDTEMEIAGPAAGHYRMKTSADPAGVVCIGTLNNCAGGITPWGTYLMAEENFHHYFGGILKNGHPEARNYRRCGVPSDWCAWPKFHKRFDINAEPNEANRFGWVVEVDVFDPNSRPKKRTALGRFKHEGAEPIVNSDGRVVVYMGDDQRFDYLYRFVSEGRYSPDDRPANMDLLDSGTLSVARFYEDGSLEWLPLVHGEGPLTAENGFYSQADVVIEARTAADMLGATPMDRPEDVEPNPWADKVYVMLTNNSARTADAVDSPNPRGPNHFGQIVELSPPEGNHTAERFTWELLVVAGNPKYSESGAMYHEATSENGWFGSPDNCCVDARGRLWVSTDQGPNWMKTGNADGLFGLETEGDLRGYSKMFFRTPIGAELCSPRFTADNGTLFVAVQHPGTDGTEHFPGFERNSTFEDPATRWPDFTEDMPPRPSVVVIQKNDGGEIGT
ncbi:PhoX family protein [Microbulbifer rhizosphaerae]|uniref:dTDP-glucose 4,6-dehydratase n=1 Tax=Microbulbifer rhizosphaerae TaxID=1562603 RepID=A0A7W4Z824_9GAMM|nr:PhoX family phosphatase [Microbulbifer rhizosphaerae]MBB3060132.1 hypothetical protein [Microbulbifer rhizosphaerae]